MRLGILGTALAVLPLLLLAYDSGPDPNSDGGPGSPAAACAQSGCHTGTAVNAGGGRVELQFPNGLTYTPGQKQRIRIVITDASARSYGYQLSARLSSNETRGQAGMSRADQKFAIRAEQKGTTLGEESVDKTDDMGAAVA